MELGSLQKVTNRMFFFTFVFNVLKDPKRRQKGVNGSLKISFEIFSHYTKITPIPDENFEVKISRPTRDKSKRVLAKVETQRNRRNAIWNSNDQTAHKTIPADSTIVPVDCPLQYPQ